ncbi:hypothetical protein CFS9_37250 [Flavobacterium sp. CFS9]|uniref:Peptidase S9 prolyl oligopeptidase catalytic domain-containing protein n=1 Tax=Flavobacterium sp. CFS9 TaxID=3143118 RepID=A0AAT9H6P5_9FLAO
MASKNKRFSLKEVQLKDCLIYLFFLFVLQLETCPLNGQALQKKELEEKDYRLWAETFIDKFSSDGRWTSYSLQYENNRDTLFIRNITDTGKTFNIPMGYNSCITSDQYFYAQTKDSLSFIDLSNGQQKSISNVSSYQYNEQYNLIILLKANAGKEKSLLIQSPDGRIIKSVEHATQFSLCPKNKWLIVSTCSSGSCKLILINLKDKSEKQIASGSNHFTEFSWDPHGRAVAFYSLSPDRKINSIFMYRNDLKRLFEFNSGVPQGLPEGAEIVSSPPDKILISEDLQRVFFHIRKRKSDKLSKSYSQPEVWNTNDKLVYSYAYIGEIPSETLKIMMWEPNKGRSIEVSTDELPEVFFTGNQKYAILSNKLQYEPQFTLYAPRDYYLLNLATMQRKKILSRFSSYYEYLTASPDGRYLAYFKDGNWWTYNIIKDLHTNLTQNLQTVFNGKVHTLVSNSAFGQAGWSSSNTEILLYDQFDIWAVRFDGSKARRLTHGREKEIKFRFGCDPGSALLNSTYGSLNHEVYDLTKEIILNARGADEKTGFFLWKENIGEKPIVYEDAYIDQLKYSFSGKKFLYRIQKFSLPPGLVIQQEDLRQSTIFQSNAQHSNYHWGNNELVTFENSKHQKLKGVLYYPALYDPTKKYPMIVHVYENQSKNLHLYSIPTLKNETGFNPAVFTSKGYFFFLPDIIIEDENQGLSSLDCAESGVKKILSMNIVNPEGVGLMGHSFGGYESAFIANRSSLFKTAVVSGAITDLGRFYLTVNWKTGRPDIWRFQGDQWNMNNKDPFNYPDVYNRNSPVAYINSLKIPLLTWSGRADTQVDWQQTVEYHMALRRLGKKNVMLLYPNEGHGLAIPSNQEDLTHRVLQWFDYFLKEEKISGWIDNAMN